MALGLVTGTSSAAEQTILGVSGAWQAIEAVTNGKRLCYLVSAPTQRLPRDLKRDPAHLFITLQKGKRRTETSIAFGYPLAQSEHQASTGGQVFALFATGGNAWLRDDSQEDAFLAALKAGRELTVTARSARGNDTTDMYSLIGFGAAHAALLERCRL